MGKSFRKNSSHNKVNKHDKKIPNRFKHSSNNHNHHKHTNIDPDSSTEDDIWSS